MKRIFLFMAVVVLTCACQESLEERAARESVAYTKKNCPATLNKFTRLDSLTFDIKSKTFTQHLTLLIDSLTPDSVAKMKHQLQEALVEAIRNDTNQKIYKDAGYSFRFVARAKEDKTVVLYDNTISKEDYKY